ncbi:ribosomal RNA small subunit methyltransferase A, partial [archaeon]|nr:ribosomal RNA small subunit methyltransferase A [archaeon]
MYTSIYNICCYHNIVATMFFYIDTFKRLIMGKIQNLSRYGQHFMTDKTFIDRIIASAKIKKDETILEIGAGTGILTEEIAKAGCRIISYEIDRQFEKGHKTLKKKYPGITFIYKDALFSDFPAFDKIIANIPYNISEPLMLKLSKTRFKEGILTVNKSFADRMLNQSKIKSLLSLVMPAYFKTEHIEDVPKTAFTPPPRIASSIIRITPIKKEDLEDDAEKYILRLLYDQRSRKVGNALMEAIIDLKSARDNKRYTKKESKETIRKA